MSTKLTSVPLIDLKAQYLSHKEEINSALSRVLSKGNYVMGEEVEKFEESWARYCKAKYCVALSSCTDALYLALRSACIFNKRIITTPMTFYATTLAILKTDNIPIFVDINETGNIPDNCFGSDVAIPVHLYGRPGHWTGDFVIEDSAQAHGLPLQGLIACYSFYPTKNLGAMGQAGALVTNDETIYKRVRFDRNYSEGKRFVHHSSYGGNYRIDEIQAAILNVKLPYLDSYNKKRRQIAYMYNTELQSVSYCIKLPRHHPQHNYHIYAIRLESRDILAEYLKEQGIQTAVRYPVPMHLQPILENSAYGYDRGSLPKAEAWAKENLSLPIYPEMPPEYVEYVIEKIKEWVYREAKS